MRASVPASFQPRGGNGAGPERVQGVTVVEVLVTLAIILIVSAVALPLTDRMRQEGKVRGAAYAIATRCGWLRIASVHRGARVAMRLTPSGASWTAQSFVDGDWDGVLSADIASGRDPAIDQPLDVRQWGVEFGFAAGCPLIDGSAVPAGASPVRLGTSRMLVFTPDGASSGGSLYLRGAAGTAAYAVVILAATGRSRLLRCAAGSTTWIEQ